MSIYELNNKFDDIYLSGTDNIFEAINTYANDANNLKQVYHNRISSSEALNSVLTNELPENINKRRLVAETEFNYINVYIKEELSQIDDLRIRQSVQESLITSRDAHNLLFIYHSDLSLCERSRVRIICKMVWNNLYPKGVS